MKKNLEVRNPCLFRESHLTNCLYFRRAFYIIKIHDRYRYSPRGAAPIFCSSSCIVKFLNCLGREFAPVRFGFNLVRGAAIYLEARRSHRGARNRHSPEMHNANGPKSLHLIRIILNFKVTKRNFCGFRISLNSHASG